MGGQGTETGNPFWDFSLDVYGRDGVAAACLALQDRHGIDVNLVLFCLWAGRRGHAVSAAELTRLMTVTRSWQQDIVAPLRAVRRHLKTVGLAGGQLRDRIRTAELMAEEAEQKMLFDAISIAPRADEKGAPAVAAGNMGAYLTVLGVTADAATVENLATILRGAYPSLSTSQAASAVTS